MDPFSIIQNQLSQLNRNFNEAIRGFQQDIMNLSRRIELLEGRQTQETAETNAKLIELKGRLGGFIKYQERHLGLANTNEGDMNPAQTLSNFHFKKEPSPVSSVKSTASTFNTDSNTNQFSNTASTTGTERPNSDQMIQRSVGENDNTAAQILTNIKPVTYVYGHGRSVSMMPMVSQSQTQNKFPSDISVNLSQQLPLGSASLIQPNSTIPQVPLLVQPQPLTPIHHQNGNNSLIPQNPIMLSNNTPTGVHQRVSSAPPIHHDPIANTGTPVNINLKTGSPQHSVKGSQQQSPYPLASNQVNQLQQTPQQDQMKSSSTPATNKTAFLQSTPMQIQPSHGTAPLPYILPKDRSAEALDSEMDAAEIEHWNRVEFEVLNPVPQSVHDVIEEWESGYRGQPPLKYMERYRKAWRKGNKNLSKKFCRRHRIIAAIEVGIAMYTKEGGLSYGEAKDRCIKELEESRTKDDGKKETMYWLFHNIPQHLKKVTVSESGEE
ncbi:hypothetical protein WICPIJ_006623 [Wickerhamomyces pijperi]|uniref:Transcription activator GCR1-like domain-containing protein n=1 Tax=Wickerhamomyces pijperi TaxID=599730 RepID=A0A9P8TK25_WICPI|nr:hypothetical protein WICPIJ_006623 [Wickerhamomyces pijperi]